MAVPQAQIAGNPSVGRQISSKTVKSGTDCPVLFFQTPFIGRSCPLRREVAVIKAFHLSTGCARDVYGSNRPRGAAPEHPQLHGHLPQRAM
eukprot:6669758-Lingulodinium_polyedra.AAC.1